MFKSKIMLLGLLVGIMVSGVVNAEVKSASCPGGKKYVLCSSNSWDNKKCGHFYKGSHPGVLWVNADPTVADVNICSDLTILASSVHTENYEEDWKGVKDPCSASDCIYH